MKRIAYHGGAFWERLGPEMLSLQKSKKIINADVLDAWFKPAPKISKLLCKNMDFLIKTSPPTHSEGLIRVISKIRKIPMDNILVGGGSSDIMFTFFTNFLNKNSKVLILDPMYGEYQHIFENLIGLNLFRHNLKEEKSFKINKDYLVDDIEKIKPNMVVLVNPNSPTGKYWPKKNIEYLVRKFPKTLFVIDETYIDYVGDKYSLEKRASKLENLVIIKSMSKVYALSGLRVGYMVGCKKIIDNLVNFFPPWSVGIFGQLAGVLALQDKKYYRQKYLETKILKNELKKSLDKLNLKIFDSCANFLLIKVSNYSAGKIIEKLREKGIYLRNCDSMSKQFEDSFIRIAVKDKFSNRKVVNSLRKLLN